MTTRRFLALAASSALVGYAVRKFVDSRVEAFEGRDDLAERLEDAVVDFHDRVGKVNVRLDEFFVAPSVGSAIPSESQLHCCQPGQGRAERGAQVRDVVGHVVSHGASVRSVIKSPEPSDVDGAASPDSAFARGGWIG